ncbi:MAG: biotin/lipoyl-binding protein, partial [Eubacteriales bacterium]
MEINAKRKDIIKNITIIFLIIMLVLTFFSATIMNRSLPEVAAQYAYSGQITTSVRMNGVTTANENYQVIIEEGRVIQSVNVRRGDSVAAGDILFLLEDGESTEMQQALDKLNEAKVAYEKWQLQIESDIADRER